jgi:hypothetical protein
MREIGMTGAPGLARGTRKDTKGRRRTASRIPSRSLRLIRVVSIYLGFATVLIGSAYMTARSVLDERERHQIEMDLRKVDEKRKGRIVHALQDGQCRMARFDNMSGQTQGNVTQSCDAPMKDPVAAARDFNWGNKANGVNGATAPN